MVRPAPFVGAALGALVFALPALASADEPPVGGPRTDGIVWEDPAATASRRSPSAFIGGLVAAGLGVATTVAGVAVFSSGHEVICPLERNISFPSSSGCDDTRATMHLAGGVMIGIGAAATLVGVPLAIWGASREAPAADVRVGLGSATARFTF